ncbi:MAG: addiction module protein [bacterium]|nr:addiction module protein [bacterium]
MKQITVTDIAEMTLRDRVQLVEDIWDSIAEISEFIEVPEWHKEELDKRLKAYHDNPNAGSPWPEVKQRIIGK